MVPAHHHDLHEREVETRHDRRKTGVYVRADATKLRQVLINLLGHAVKFTDVGSVVMRSRATVADSECLRLRFEVEDTGPGIAAEDQARIFEPFVQASHSGRQKGTGLGLAITKRFVEVYGRDNRAGERVRPRHTVHGESARGGSSVLGGDRDRAMDAVISLDRQRVDSVIDRVNEWNETIAKSLTWFRDRFNSTAILNAIRQSEAARNTPGIPRSCQLALSDESYPEGNRGLSHRKVPDGCH